MSNTSHCVCPKPLNNNNNESIAGIEEATTSPPLPPKFIRSSKINELKMHSPDSIIISNTRPHSCPTDESNLLSPPIPPRKSTNLKLNKCSNIITNELLDKTVKQIHHRSEHRHKSLDRKKSRSKTRSTSNKEKNVESNLQCNKNQYLDNFDKIDDTLKANYSTEINNQSYECNDKPDLIPINVDLSNNIDSRINSSAGKPPRKLKQIITHKFAQFASYISKSRRNTQGASISTNSESVRNESSKPRRSKSLHHIDNPGLSSPLMHVQPIHNFDHQRDSNNILAVISPATTRWNKRNLFCVSPKESTKRNFDKSISPVHLKHEKIVKCNENVENSKSAECTKIYNQINKCNPHCNCRHPQQFVESSIIGANSLHKFNIPMKPPNSLHYNQTNCCNSKCQHSNIINNDTEYHANDNSNMVCFRNQLSNFPQLSQQSQHHHNHHQQHHNYHQQISNTPFCINSPPPSHSMSPLLCSCCHRPIYCYTCSTQICHHHSHPPQIYNSFHPSLPPSALPPARNTHHHQSQIPSPKSQQSSIGNNQILASSTTSTTNRSASRIRTSYSKTPPPCFHTDQKPIDNNSQSLSFRDDNLHANHHQKYHNHHYNQQRRSNTYQPHQHLNHSNNAPSSPPPLPPPPLPPPSLQQQQLQQQNLQCNLCLLNNQQRVCCMPQSQCTSCGNRIYEGVDSSSIFSSNNNNNSTTPNFNCNIISLNNNISNISATSNNNPNIPSGSGATSAGSPPLNNNNNNNMMISTNNIPNHSRIFNQQHKQQNNNSTIGAIVSATPADSMADFKWQQPSEPICCNHCINQYSDNCGRCSSDLRMGCCRSSMHRSFTQEKPHRRRLNSSRGSNYEPIDGEADSFTIRNHNYNPHNHPPPPPPTRPHQHHRFRSPPLTNSNINNNSNNLRPSSSPLERPPCINNSPSNNNNNMTISNRSGINSNSITNSGTSIPPSTITSTVTSTIPEISNPTDSNSHSIVSTGLNTTTTTLHTSSTDSWRIIFHQNMLALRNLGWYWGPLNYIEAEKLVNGHVDGTFLVRDSGHDTHFLSLTFRVHGTTYHTRIEYSQGKFSFWSQPESHSAATIVEFIDKAVAHSQSGKFHYFLQTSTVGQPPMEVSLLYPLSRHQVVQPLQHLARFVILNNIRKDHISILGLPRILDEFLREKQIFVDDINKFCILTKDSEPLTYQPSGLNNTNTNNINNHNGSHGNSNRNNNS